MKKSPTLIRNTLITFYILNSSICTKQLNTYFYWQVKKQCKASQQQGKKLQDKEKVEVQKDSF